MDEIIKLLRIFNKQREWGQFHSPKNLAVALSVEVAELSEIMMWKTQKETLSLMRGLDRHKIFEEIADIFIYALILADKLNIDVEQAIKTKIITNAKKYPIKKARGSNKKYTPL